MLTQDRDLDCKNNSGAPVPSIDKTQTLLIADRMLPLAADPESLYQQISQETFPLVLVSVYLRS